MFRYGCVEGICTLVLASQVVQVGLGTTVETKGWPHTLALALELNIASSLRGWSTGAFIQKG